MREKNRYFKLALPFILLMFWVIPAAAEVYIQCPCLALDANGKPDPTNLLGLGLYAPTGVTITTAAAYNAATQNIECKYTAPDPRPPHAIVAHNAACKALSAGDGHVVMGDGNDIFIFGFDDVTGVPTDQVMNFVNDPVNPGGMRGAEASAPTINIQAGQEFYLSLTNVSMFERPDLFDPHTVHYHGFPNAGSIFDGEPMASIAVPIGETFTYYYNNVEPGTYMFHCHVEASEHMQMGMLGNLYVRPQQDGTTVGGCLSQLYAYNDGDGSTCYNVGYPMQITGFDPIFHHDDNSYNSLDFANMNDTYNLFNGRGYPYTINPCGRQTAYPVQNYPACTPGMTTQLTNLVGVVSQNVSALVTASVGQKILLHFPSLATVDFNTVTLLGLPMKVVGQGARQYKGPTGLTYYYNTNSITLGGGEGYDILIDTTGAQAGTYFLYTTNLNLLSNNNEDFGGMMTEIVIN